MRIQHLLVIWSKTPQSDCTIPGLANLTVTIEFSESSELLVANFEFSENLAILEAKFKFSCEIWI